MIVFLTVINVILTVVIIVMVLLQQGKGSDLGSAFGGGSSNSMFGALGPSDFLGEVNICGSCNMVNPFFAVSIFIKD